MQRMILSTMIILAGCTMTKQQTTPAVVKTSISPWFQGGVDTGLQFAATEKRPVMIYWGAVWCPPCGEIKSQVFEHPEFNQLMTNVVGIYIDGDEPHAQTYGERFKISGYPTILVLSPTGEEIMRIDHGTSYAEFATALRAALQASDDLPQLVKKLREDKGTPEEWARIAYHYGSGTEVDLQARYELYRGCPNTLPAIKARLAAQLLQSAASWTKEKQQEEAKTWQQVEPELAMALRYAFSNQTTRVAARSTLIYSAPGILEIMPEKERQALQTQWLTTMDALAQDTSLSIDTRLWTVYPQVQFHLKQQGEDATFPAPLKQKVIAAVNAADRRATSKNSRKAVISGAAYLLRIVGEVDQAREMLRKELMITKTPWYYHSSLASLEDAAGNREAALQWSAKARESAQGRATRLQWTVNDLRLTAKVVDKKMLPRMQTLVDAYYDLAFSLPDGFSGRNALRATFVATALKPWMEQPTVASVVSRFSGKCSALAGEQKKRCEEHFAKLAGGKT